MMNNHSQVRLYQDGIPLYLGRVSGIEHRLVKVEPGELGFTPQSYVELEVVGRSPSAFERLPAIVVSSEIDALKLAIECEALVSPPTLSDLD